MGWLLIAIIAVALAVLLISVLFFIQLVTPSRTLARLWGGFYSIDLDRISLQSADNVRMLSPDQIDAFEERLEDS